MASCANIFEEGMKVKIDFHQHLMAVLKRNLTSFSADKAAWLLSSIIGHYPKYFTAAQTQALLDYMTTPGGTCSKYGVLDATSNLLKCNEFRQQVFESPGIRERILGANEDAKTAAFQYKSLFCVWMLSYDTEITEDMQRNGIMEWLRDIVTTCRVEKVVRLSLTVIKNFMKNQALCEAMVEGGLRD